MIKDRDALVRQATKLFNESRRLDQQGEHQAADRKWAEGMWALRRWEDLASSTGPL